MIRQPANTHLAQLNIGRLRSPTDDPQVADFMNALDRVNAMGKRMPGFVWMMEGSGEPGTGNTEAARDGDPLAITNLTVWKDVPSLEKFVHQTVHAGFFARRAEWFEPSEQAHFVMWWVPRGHRPDVAEALARLGHLRRFGPDAHAFDWNSSGDRDDADDRKGADGRDDADTSQQPRDTAGGRPA